MKIFKDFLNEARTENEFNVLKQMIRKSLGITKDGVVNIDTNDIPVLVQEIMNHFNPKSDKTKSLSSAEIINNFKKKI